MNRRLARFILPFIAVAVALAFRLPKLSLRPMHGDEAVHAYKFNTLWQSGRYTYDPEEFHGPTLNYFTLPAMWLSGAPADYGGVGAATFRIVPVAFGLGLILLLPLIADGLGRGAAVCAGLLTAISPAMVFCSRYYIQETLLVFFTFALMAAGWRYVRTRRIGWALAGGACLGLMHATKETSIIAFGTMGMALVGTILWSDPSPTLGKGGGPSSSTIKALGGAAIVAIVVSVTLFSAFFTNASAPIDSLRTYATWLDRAGGGGLHDHPWYYYLRMLLYTHYAPGPVWSEGLIVVLAIVGLVAVGTRRGIDAAALPLLRFVSAYTVLMVVVYSALPYKTPWSMLGFLHGMILLAGVGVIALLRGLRRVRADPPNSAIPLPHGRGSVENPLPDGRGSVCPRWLQAPAAAALLVATAQLGLQSYRTNLDARFFTDHRNPYVYAHPLRGVERMGAWIERLARIHPDGDRMLVKVIMPNAWPVPWYLRRLQRVGYWERPPDDCDAPVVVTSSEATDWLDERLRNEYGRYTYSLRPDVRLLVYVDTELWDAFVKSEQRGERSPADQSEPQPGLTRQP